MYLQNVTSFGNMEDIKKIIVPVLRRYGVRRAAVFGSFARGEAREDSDLDIIVEFEEGRSLLDLAGLKVELEDVLGRRMDIEDAVIRRLEIIGEAVELLPPDIKNRHPEVP